MSLRKESKNRNYKNETYKHISNQLLVQALIQRQWKDAESIVYNDEAYTRIKDPKGFLPIHLALKGGGTPTLCVRILTAYPECIVERDPEGYLPLHLACQHSKERLWVSISEIATVIYSAYPQAIMARDAQGNLPLHLALRNRGPDSLIKFLLHESPATAKEQDGMGNTPLHLAMQFNASMEVVHCLLEHFRDAVKVPNNSGGVPLHKAAQCNPPMDVLNMLIEADPLATMVEDKRGNRPLHLLFLFCGGPPSEERLRLFLQGDAMAIGTRNQDGMTPFMMVNRPQDRRVEDYR